MSKLLISELVTSLTQNFSVLPSKRINLAGIYPHIYIHNDPVGGFTFTLRKGVTVIFSKTFTSASIKASMNTSQDYAHLWLPVIPSSEVYLEEGDYSFELTSSGYTYSDSAYLSWCRNFEEQEIVNELSIQDKINSLQIKFLKRELQV